MRERNLFALAQVAVLSSALKVLVGIYRQFSRDFSATKRVSSADFSKLFATQLVVRRKGILHKEWCFPTRFSVNKHCG
jgi:hypothetical protein